jgi:hypothetical protein
MLNKANIEGMTYEQSQQNGLIQYNSFYAGNKVGTVDMVKYKQWLSNNLNVQLQ